MTAIRPTETARVRAVSSVRYPGNTTCGHPECTAGTDEFHHIFPRSLIKSSSWFVEIDPSGVEDLYDKSEPSRSWSKRAIPHVIGLCRTHHEDVEQHRAWIKYGEGGFFWFDRIEAQVGDERVDDWLGLGALVPQPGSREGKQKRKKFKGEKARNRVVKAIRVPKDEQENGIEVLETLIAEAGKKLAPQMGWDEKVPDYYVLTASLAQVLQ